MLDDLVIHTWRSFSALLGIVLRAVDVLLTIPREKDPHQAGGALMERGLSTH